jgi:hypothetical protein
METDVVTRATGEMVADQNIEKVRETRTIRFLASTTARDRHRTVVNQKNWKLDNFNANPIIGYQHNLYGDMCNVPDPDDVIGKGRAFIEGEKLFVDVTFEPKELNAKADKIFEKILNGSLRAVSVGFLELGKGKYGEGEERQGGSKETYYFEGQELIELSIVNIPSNPEALKKSVRNSNLSAMIYLRNLLDMSSSDIRNLTVGEVLDRVEKANNKEQSTSKEEEENNKLELKNKAKALELKAKANL